jgi:hypothetical protein
MASSLRGERAAVALGLALTAMLLPREGAAQPADEGAAARAAFERARTSVQRERYAEAALDFEESYRLRPVPVVLYNLAGAYERMGRIRMSIETYTRYLATAGASLPSERIRFVQDALVRLRELLCTVRITPSPATASISVDGRDETPTSAGFLLDPGERVFVASALGHVPRRVTRVLRPGEVTHLELTLVPLVSARPSEDPRAGDFRESRTDNSLSSPTHASIARSPWFWTGVGLAAAGTAVVVMAILGVFNQYPPPPEGLDYGVNAITGR